MNNLYCYNWSRVTNYGKHIKEREREEGNMEQVEKRVTKTKRLNSNKIIGLSYISLFISKTLNSFGRIYLIPLTTIAYSELKFPSNITKESVRIIQLYFYKRKKLSI